MASFPNPNMGKNTSQLTGSNQVNILGSVLGNISTVWWPITLREKNARYENFLNKESDYRTKETQNKITHFMQAAAKTNWE